MEFSSDGVSWAAPEILDRLTKEAHLDDALFDDDAATAELHRRVESVFGREADVFTVITGCQWVGPRGADAPLRCCPCALGCSYSY